MHVQISKELHALADKEKAEFAQRFFKTEKGSYGYGDVFLGIRVPQVRAIAKKHKDASLKSIEKLLTSKYHEIRLCALIMMYQLYQRSDQNDKQIIYDSYLAHTAYINNWDLVDCSAHKIVGPHVLASSKQPLYELAKSEDMWERRIAIIATLALIKHDIFTPTLRICKMLLTDEEDLIHKASGWMLRELAKRDQASAEQFLKQHVKKMPRTMLRYAIERFPKALRQEYLKK